MIYEKRYLQFNNLVFDGYDMISDYSADVSFKSNTTEYSYRHGSYAPLKNPYMLLREGSVSMTLTLKLRKVPCEQRAYYVRFAEEELSRPGKLWAIKNNELIWAYAYVTSINQVISMRNDEVTYDIDFVIPEGVWHKADKQKTFLLPYDVCVFMDCKGYKTLDPCAVKGIDCCNCTPNVITVPEREDCFCCCVDEITEDMMLCYHTDELQRFYSCETPYQIVYDCLHGEKFSDEEFLGQKLCAEDNCEQYIIAGRIYSETDIPTTDISIVIAGKMHNPEITINGNTNIIKGNYDGALIIDSSGDVRYQKDECCEGDILDPGVWSIPSGNTYGWTIRPRNNSIIVNLNECCASESGRACIYVSFENLTL